VVCQGPMLKTRGSTQGSKEEKNSGGGGGMEVKSQEGNERGQLGKKS